MNRREIPQSEWRAFLERFSREHRAWLASVERVDPQAVRRTEVLDRPLGAIVADTEGRSVVGIQIRFQQDSHGSEPVRVESPLRLHVDETEDGAARAIEIENDQGECTRLRLRVVAPPGMLDGVAPGEV